MNSRQEELDQFRHEVNCNLAFGAVHDMELVTNDQGDCPVVVALDDEPLSVILGRVRAVGGYGTVFSRSADCNVRTVSLIHTACSLSADPDVLAPGPDSCFGMFLDYVAMHPEGVAIPAAFDSPAKAQDARAVELSHA
ncbi:hypothetical protein QSJ18_18425 [Gordonia sp. ABSL1-1]|uniref:hypothetical protein n=1 Tax=Gordonia sp. ABSL1-1 TaxID=3053923 RepID=UPI0025722A63|nr:hypothetical protein [Gordonia sp. ABSL1-1]MDL9938727.1 hypothetical protein [Gordonia sp. ABSL1-1]